MQVGLNLTCVTSWEEEIRTQPHRGKVACRHREKMLTCKACCEAPEGTKPAGAVSVKLPAPDL